MSANTVNSEDYRQSGAGALSRIFFMRRMKNIHRYLTIPQSVCSVLLGTTYIQYIISKKIYDIYRSRWNERRI